MTPFSWPVNTFSATLDKRSKARPKSGSTSRPTMGSLRSTSSTINRRLAFSATANAAIAILSASLGRILVSAHEVHSCGTGATFTSQLHSAACRFAHNRYSLASTAPPCSLSSPLAMTRKAIWSRENPNRLRHDRHTEFSKAKCCPQFGQMKSRTGHIPRQGSHVDRHVDLAALRIGVDDAAQRWHVHVVAAETGDHVALVDQRVVGGVETKPLILRCPHGRPGVRRVDPDHAFPSRGWVRRE